MGESEQWQGHKGEVLDSAGKFQIIECESCGFKHVIPMPSPAELDEIYRHEYYSREKPLYLERHREDLPWWNLVYDERYAAFEEHLPSANRRLLDIGSGPGYFLLRGKERGWDTTGVEPSQQSAAHSRALGLAVVEEFFSQEVAQALGTFDVVHLSQVLEHIPDPADFMALVHDAVAPGGLTCVVVPNDYSPLQHALREACGFAPWWVAPPHHLNYFDFRSLAQLLTRSGFDVIHQTTTFPIDLFLLMGENYVGNDALGRTCHERRKLLELNLDRAGLSPLKHQLYRSLAELGVGREVVLLARKVRD